MSTLLDEKFDGVTAPALPSGWTWGTGYATTASPSGGIAPTSSPNCLTLATTGTGNHIFSFYGTADTNGGDLTISLKVNGTGAGHQAWGLVARSSSSSVPPLSTTCYWVVFDAFNQDLALHKIISGSPSVVGSSVSLASAPLPEWYQVTWTLGGTSLSVAIQDLGSGDWLNSSGAWQAGAATALSLTDSSITGSGYYGLSGVAASGPVYFDDLLVTTSTAGSAATSAKTESHDAGSLTGAFATAGSSAPTERHDTGSIAGAFAASGAPAPTERRDAGSLASIFAAPAALTKAESRDAGPMAAATMAPAALSPTEHHDTGSLAGTCNTATIVVTEGRDTASTGGAVQTAILTRLEGADFAAPAASAAFTSGGTAGATEAGDTPSIHGFVPAAVITGAEARDTASLGGLFEAKATEGISERRDSASIAGVARNSNTLAATEARDTASIAGVAPGTGRVSTTERRDVAAIVAAPRIMSILAAAEAGDRGGILAVAEGVPPAFKVKESGDVAAFLAGSSTLHYNIYASPLPDLPIDYSAPIGTTAATTWTTSTLAVPGTWGFGVRAANANGEEQNLDCSVYVTFDAAGRDISNIPAPPIGLRAFATAGAGIKVEWAATPAAGPKAPTGFHVYCTAGATLSYATPAATVAANTAIQGTYRATLSGVDGTAYSVGVRAYNASGEEANTARVSVTADGTGPANV